MTRRFKVVVLPGDGIGPEVTEAALLVLDAVTEVRPEVQLKLIKADAGLYAIEKYGTNLPQETVELLKESDCVFKGPITTLEDPKAPPSVAVQIRKMFNLYANVRPAKSYPGTRALKQMDMVIVRENTEGLYSGIEFSVGEDAGVALRVITRKACLKVAEFSFKLAMQRRKKLTFVHKANILRLTDNIFKKAVYDAGRRYPEVQIEEVHIDAMARNLVRKPDEYDVVVTENLFGDILSDEAAEVAGGLGLAPAANIGDNYAMFEPVHGTAPKMAGKRIANPTAAILSMKMMLEWLGFKEAAKLVKDAVVDVLREGKVVTYDLGGNAKTDEMARAIAAKVRERSQA